MSSNMLVGSLAYMDFWVHGGSPSCMLLVILALCLSLYYLSSAIENHVARHPICFYE